MVRARIWRRKAVVQRTETGVFGIRKGGRIWGRRASGTGRDQPCFWRSICARRHCDVPQRRPARVCPSPAIRTRGTADPDHEILGRWATLNAHARAYEAPILCSVISSVSTMAPSLVHLPNGHTLTVTPVFGGLYFKANELAHHQSPFPPGWTIVLNSNDGVEIEDSRHYSIAGIETPKEEDTADSNGSSVRVPRRNIHRFRKPTLRNDHLYISSISNPSSSEFKPPTSPTRSVAMMLWATLWWYFHQAEPEPYLYTPTSAKTPDEGKPKGDWRVNINREGIFKGKILHKLERMGLISSEDSSVGIDPDERSSEGWNEMFVSRKSFWQLDPRIYLFSHSPAGTNSPFPTGTPLNSRPGSPARTADNVRPESVITEAPLSPGLWSPTPNSGPFRSGSHLPTYFPPPPPQFTFTNGIRHPIRPKPPRQGEPFYSRYVPSVGQYLSFRVASLSPNPCPHRGPVAQERLHGAANPCNKSDTEYLHAWMNDPRVAKYWGETGDLAHMTAFLTRALSSRHSFPVIGSWDGKPFGYFEIYWVKEDLLGRYLGAEVDHYDRGLHCLVGEEEFRGPQRVKTWLSALVHYCWLADSRTNTTMMEPRVDNLKYATPPPNLYPNSPLVEKMLTNNPY